MNIRFPIGILICVVLLILTIIFYPTNELDFDSESQNASLTAKKETTKPILEDLSQVPPSSNKGLNATHADKFSSFSPKTESPATIPLPSSSLFLTMQDALGERIPKGQIKCLGEYHPFRDGTLLLQNLDTESFPLTAIAEGYANKSVKADLQQANHMVLTMKYLTMYTIRVYRDKEMKSPCPGAKVTLYKGPTPFRPLRNDTQIPIQGFNPWQFYPCKLQIDLHNGMHIHDVLNPETGIPDPATILRDKRTSPQPGDRIQGVGDCLWMQGSSLEYEPYFSRGRIHYLPFSNAPSRHLRLWDTLCLAADTRTHGSHGEDILHLTRDGKAGFTRFPLPQPQKNRQRLMAATTDGAGTCRFTNLSPGLYFVQAEKDGMRSSSFALHPGCSGIKLALLSGTRLRVQAHRGNPNLHVSQVEGVKFTLMHANGKGLFSGVTNNNGVVYFNDVPFGNYQVTGQAPQGESWPYISRQVTIHEPRQRLHMYFEGGEEREIAGIVQHKETKEPIPGYPLYLKQRGAVYPRVLSQSVSASDGRFRFGPLPPGEYDIKTYLGAKQPLEFLPWHGPTAFPFLDGNMNSRYAAKSYTLSVNVEQESETEVEFNLAPVKKTRLAGVVLYEDGSPGEDVIFEMYHTKHKFRPVRTEPANPTTNEKGEFDFSIPSQDTNQSFTGVLRAMVGELLPKDFIGGRKEVNMTAEGEATVRFRIGEEQTDLRIYVKKLSSNFIEGRVTLEDGTVPENMHLRFRQKKLTFCVPVRKDGSYRVRGVEPGRFLLSLDPTIHHRDMGEFGRRPIQDYVEPPRQPRAFPDDAESMRVDIQLMEAGYLGGRVLGPNNQPFEGVRVVGKWDSHSFIPPTQTNAQGYFFLSYGVPKNESVDLEFTRKNGQAPAARLTGLEPSRDDIVV
ncbi:hypothetical protein GF373_12420, partial [bacterium]|nr:hypothetical protein [bacterium]